MRVLMFVSQFVAGGAERLGVELAIALNRCGWKADIVSMYTRDFPGAKNEEARLLECGIGKIYYLGLKPHPSPLSVVNAVFHLMSILVQGKYSVIEASEVTPGVMAAIATWITRRRLVVGVHRIFDRSIHQGGKNLCFRLIMRYHGGRLCYAVSNAVARAWIKYTAIDGKCVRTVYNSVTEHAGHPNMTREQLREKYGFHSHEKVALCVGRITTEKRQDLVLHALGPRCKERAIRLVFVGALDSDVPGSEEMYRGMMEWIDRENLRSSIEFLGARQDVRDLMVAADVLVHASVSEAFGLVLVEAMGCGLPIIATYVDGIPEVLEGTESMMVAPYDSEAIRVAFDECLRRDESQWRRAGESGRRRAQEFCLNKRLDHMCHLYRESIELTGPEEMRFVL